MAYRQSKSRTRRASVRRPSTRKASTRRASNGGNVWSKEEISFMRKVYRNHETAWIARQLGRTVYSVRYKASDLNIKKTNPSKWVASPAKKNSFRKASSSKKRFGSTTRRTTRKASTRRPVRRASARRTTTRRSIKRRTR